MKHNLIDGRKVYLHFFVPNMSASTRVLYTRILMYDDMIISSALTVISVRAVSPSWEALLERTRYPTQGST